MCYDIVCLMYDGKNDLFWDAGGTDSINRIGVTSQLPKIQAPQKMTKILLLVLIATVAVVIASRDVRSPGGGWKGSDSFGAGGSSGSGGWANYGAGQGRTVGDGGWRGNAAFGSSARSRSGSVSGFRSGKPSNNGWLGNGDDSSSAYGGNSFRSSPGWNGIFADSAGVETLDSSSGWDKPDQRFRSNNGWQSSGW